MIKLSKTLAILLLAQAAICVSSALFQRSRGVRKEVDQYMRGRDNGVEYFYDKDALIKPSRAPFRCGEKGYFPQGRRKRRL